MISVSQAQTLSSKQNLKVCVLVIAVLMLVLNGLVPAKDNMQGKDKVRGKRKDQVKDKVQAAGKRPDTSYNHLFDIRNIEGWTVYINKKDLADHPQQMQDALDHFLWQLYQVRLNVPAPAVTIMQEKMPLWFEYDTIGIAYHHRGWLIANGYKPPDVTIMAGFCRAKTFLKGALHQPWVVFHELAHGYDHQYLRRENRRGNSLVRAAYDNAKKAGKYDPVLCRYSKGAKAYGLNNPGEFWTENSEAFLGVNDFYPFVRAELKEYDPNTYAAYQLLWGVDADDLARRERLLVDLMDSNPPPAGWAKRPVCAVAGTCPSPSTQSYQPTSAYQKRQIEGWTVYLGPKLQNQRPYGDEACKLLQYKLHLVKRYVPQKAIADLQKTPIWLERNNPAVPYVVYHQSKDNLRQKGLNPDKYRAVEIGNTRNFRQWQDLQPSVLLHHLACAYLDRLPPKDHAHLNKAYKKALENGKYDRVLRFDGQHVRHPALLNVTEYFAEMSESYYGFNDHYPFLQFELSQIDPEVCELLARLWGGKAK